MNNSKTEEAIKMKLVKDRNGLRALRVTYPGRRAFNIQTNGNMPITHKDGVGVWTRKELVDYIENHGTRRQQGLLRMGGVMHAFSIETCKFVESSGLIPDDWFSWFWCVISDNAPFSWGDNNRSLVCACDFRSHCTDRLLDAVDEQEGVTQEDIDDFLETLDALGTTYIDLEN